MSFGCPFPLLHTGFQEFLRSWRAQNSNSMIFPGFSRIEWQAARLLGMQNILLSQLGFFLVLGNLGSVGQR